MPTYIIKARDTRGILRQRKVKANSPAEARAALQNQGLFVQELTEDRGLLGNLQRLIFRYPSEPAERQKQAENQVRPSERQQAKNQAEVDVKAELEGLEYSLDLEAVKDDAEVNLNVALADAEAAPIIALVNKILVKALQEGASDIHIEPQEQHLQIRFRKDGVLQEAFDPLPNKIIPAVTARFKVIADLNIAERRLPQKGQIHRVFNERKVDFRISTLPSRYGEKMCLRMLHSSSTLLGMDRIITDPETLQIVQGMVARPFGLIVIAGPRDSGKTTTLYSATAARITPGVNISLADDPIAYTLPGVTQVQVMRGMGMNTASILQTFLDQDPDVIVVGQIADRETAEAAIKAALSGYLVLTTLHANDTASAIARLNKMIGFESFMLSTALIGVVAQHLVRRLCPSCRIPYTPIPEEIARFGLSASREVNISFYRANSLDSRQIQEARENNELCLTCKGVGYTGRCAIHEVMPITEQLQTLIAEGAPTERMKEVAVKEGMKTLLAYSLNLISQGHTTLEELERVAVMQTELAVELKARRKTLRPCRVCGAEQKQEWLDCPYCTTSRF